MWVLLAQVGNPDAVRHYDPVSIVTTAAVILAVMLGAALVGVLVWRRYSLATASEDAQGFSLSQLREMHERGELNETEYAAARAKILARFKKSDSVRVMPGNGHAKLGKRDAKAAAAEPDEASTQVDTLDAVDGPPPAARAPDEATERVESIRPAAISAAAPQAPTTCAPPEGRPPEPMPVTAAPPEGRPPEPMPVTAAPPSAQPPA